MKINYAIVSTDDSHYEDYWPVIKQAWNNIGITPILIKIHDDINYFKIGNNYIEYCLPEIDGIKTSLQAQIARIWAYKVFNGNCIMSDIDMLPISSEYFNGIAEKYNEDEIVSYCSDAAQRFDGNHPMCYVLANTKVMSSLLKHDTWEEFVRDLAAQGGQGWSTDQWYLTKLLNSYDKTVSLKRGWNEGGIAYNRLDRIGWNYENPKTYYDAHLPKPYKKNEHLINKFIEDLK